jgi:hypothetical protein
LVGAEIQYGCDQLYFALGDFPNSGYQDTLVCVSRYFLVEVMIAVGQDLPRRLSMKRILILLFALVAYPLCAMSELPNGWNQYAEAGKNILVFKPQKPGIDMTVKYYPAKLLNNSSVNDWLRHKLTQSKAPKGVWAGEIERLVQDSFNYSYARRRFREQDGSMGVLAAAAFSADSKHVRLGMLLYNEHKVNKQYQYLNQAYEILDNLSHVELADAKKERRDIDLETAAFHVAGIKTGGPIKPGLYVGEKTLNGKKPSKQSYYELMLYDTGEYEFLTGDQPVGYYTYSEGFGKLYIQNPCTNHRVTSNENYCIYGTYEKSGKPVIFAYNAPKELRMNWVKPLDRLSPRQRKQLSKMQKAQDRGYPYVTKPGEGVANDQIETILYTYQKNYYEGGANKNEVLYLLMKDGRVRQGLPVAPSLFDAAKSRSREPHRWGWWKYDDNRYSFAWDITRKDYRVPKNIQKKSMPIPAGTRFSGDWGDVSSFVSYNFSDVSFWGVVLGKNGRFERYSRRSMQGGGGGMPGGLVTSYSDDDGSVTSVVGENVGGGKRTKRKGPNSHRMGTYKFDGYNLILEYDNGVVKHLPTFATDRKFKGIWFENDHFYNKN